MGLRSMIAALTARAGVPESPTMRGKTTEAKSAGGGTLFLTGAFAEGEGSAEPGYASLARAGFMRNPVVHRAVRLQGLDGTFENPEFETEQRQQAVRHQRPGLAGPAAPFRTRLRHAAILENAKTAKLPSKPAARKSLTVVNLYD